MISTHKMSEVCDCETCLKLDSLWGDPLLTPWEYQFIGNVSRYGWFANYSKKQLTKLDQVWYKILRLRGIALK